MTLSRGIALAVVVIGAFALVTLSVVHARDPIGPAVTRSFESAAPRLAPRDATVAALGCAKSSLDFYACEALISPAGPPPAVTVSYRLWLHDDGCWTATDFEATTPPPAAHEVRGCIER